MARILTRPRTPSAAALLSRSIQPAELFIPAERHLLSALLFPEHHHERDVTGRRWDINGTPAYSYLGGASTLGHGTGFSLLSSVTNYLSTTDPVLRDLPLSDAFSVCLIGIQPNSGWTTPAQMAWSGDDDLIFYVSRDAGSNKLFWRNMGGVVLDSLLSTIYSFSIWHTTFQKAGTNIEAKAYINGIYAVSQTLSTESKRGPFIRLQVGSWADGGQNSSGGLKSIFFWDKVLSSNEVRRHANNLYGFDTRPANDAPFRYPVSIPPVTGEDNAILMASNF